MDEDNNSNLCSQCGEGFPDVQKLDNHQTCHGQSYLKQHEYKRRVKKQYKCDKCGKVFTLLSSVRKHDHTAHCGETVFSSNKCGEAYTMTPQLQDHQYTYRAIQSITCKHCGKQFMDTADFKRHKQTHTGVKVSPYRCGRCRRNFLRKGNFTMHMYMHQKKTHQCKDCGKAFSRSRSLSNHKCTHTPEKPYSCDICDKAFAEPSLLETHRCIHSRQQQHVQARKKSKSSDQCGMTLVKSSIKYKHTNSEEKAHKCGQCGKAFKNESTLRDHSLWHSKMVVIPCGECGKVFSSRQMHLSHKCLYQTPHTNNCH